MPRIVVSMFLAGALFATAEPALEMPKPAADAVTRRPSERTYRARLMPHAILHLDGKDSEKEWLKADAETHFTFPWETQEAPFTEFRAICGNRFLWFLFRVHDSDIVALDKLRDEEDEVFEDRLELYFAKDDQLKDYYCLEVDSRGRIFDYRGAFYRKLDTKWSWPGVQAKGTPLTDGYMVEGRIPLSSFKSLGFPELKPGAKIRFGMYRAEFSHDVSGKKVEQAATVHNLGRKVEGAPPIEHWMSWIDPKVKDPDFHIPATFGWLEIAK
jgi:hypothetical protein